MASNRRNLISRLQHWMDSIPGQMFMNYAYSWGAAIVILGTLFKLTHIPGANAMLFIGMGTEVFVFIISGFDRPYSLREDESDEEEEDEQTEDLVEEETSTGNRNVSEPESVGQPIVSQPNVGYAGPVIINNGGGASFGEAPLSASVSAEPQPQVADHNIHETVSGGAAAPQAFDLKALADMVNASNAEFLQAARTACAPEMEEAASAYVDELKKLTETLSRVSAQAESLTRDSQEMENLNRLLTGINTIYEVQLKSISTQVGTIDQINEQTRRMARQIEDLNGIYSRMIKALTVNMKNAAGNASADQY